MQRSVIDLYERLSNAPDERARAKIIAEAFDELENRYPNLGDMATERALSETELRLKLEIEKTHVKIEQVRADLSKEIEQTHVKIEQVRADLSKEIEQTHVKIEQVRADLSKEIEQSKVEMMKWSAAFWLTNFSAIMFVIWKLMTNG